MSSYTTQKETAQELREQLTARVDLRFGKYFGSVGTLYEFYCNSRSHALTRHNVILNASAGRKFGKENRLGLSAGHRHPQPPRLHHHEFRHGLHRHLLNLLPGPLRLPARRLHVLIGSRPELRCYFGLFRIVSHIFVSLDAETV
jgi:hypothetical protein